MIFMRVAIVHDMLIRMGGAERVVLALKDLYPDAPIYTLLYDRKKMEPWFGNFEVRTSWLQKLPGWARKKHRYLLNLMPLAVESFDLRDFDLVISSSTAYAKGVITRANAKHICYCHSPARFLWDFTHAYVESQNLGWLKRQAAIRSIHKLRLWDKSSAKRVDYFVANSKTTQQKIAKYYRRDSQIIYPPIPDLKFGREQREADETKTKKNDYFLIVSQLVKHKKIDVAVEAFNKLELPLMIIGEGPERKALQKMAGDNVKFLGFLSDDQVARYLQDCRAFIFAGEDDFGIAPVQAMKFGKPVLALRIGGALETIREGVSGEFFDYPLPEIMADGVRRLLEKQYDENIIKKTVERFAEENFRRNFRNLAEEVRRA